MKKFLLSLFLLGMTLIPNVVSAETQIIEADGDYVLGDGENVIDAKERSKEVALKNASMQAAVFVESVLKVDNGMVSEDEITVITSNVLQLQKEPEYKNIVDDKSIIIRCHVVALIDTDNVEKIINNRMKDSEDQDSEKNSDEDQNQDSERDRNYEQDRDENREPSRIRDHKPQKIEPVQPSQKPIEPPKPTKHLEPRKPPQVQTPGPDGRPPDLPPDYRKNR